MISRFLNPQGGPVQQSNDPFSLLSLKPIRPDQIVA